MPFIRLLRTLRFRLNRQQTQADQEQAAHGRVTPGQDARQKKEKCNRRMDRDPESLQRDARVWLDDRER